MDEEIKDQNNINTSNEDEKITKLEKERDEYLQGWQRAKADFINYKKDEMRRMEEVTRYSHEIIIRELIVIMDNFDLGIRAMEREGTVDKGVYMIRAQMEDVLKKYGLKKIEIKVGDDFDPAIAEAIAVVDGEGPPGSVQEEIEPGYILHDKVIRPARVKVIKQK